jgi:hypothetical protein
MKYQSAVWHFEGLRGLRNAFDIDGLVDRLSLV